MQWRSGSVEPNSVLVNIELLILRSISQPYNHATKQRCNFIYIVSYTATHSFLAIEVSEEVVAKRSAGIVESYLLVECVDFLQILRLKLEIALQV